MASKKFERKTKFKSVDISMVEKLLKYQEIKNEQFRGTEYSCDLYPRKTSEPCISCEFLKDCQHYGWEREYIKRKSCAKRDADIRSLKREKAEIRHLTEDVEQEYDEPEFVCSPFEFSCPHSDECNRMECLYAND